jgi:beta-lactamase class D
MSHANAEKIDFTDNAHKYVYEQIFNDLNLNSLDINLHRAIMNNNIKNMKQLDMVSNHLVIIRDNCPLNYCNKKVLSVIVSRLWAKSCLNVAKYEKVYFINSIKNRAFTFDTKALKIILKASLKRR